MRDGATAHDVHRAVSKGFTDRGYHLGHVTGHSIGMTMIEHPRVGEGSRPCCAGHGALDAPARDRGDGKAASTCRTRGSSATDGGEPLSRLPMRVF
jgi:Xaa-Pro aminopeptidase